MATPLQLMLLFNVLNRSDAAPFADKENSLSVVANDSTLAKRYYFIENIPVSMSVADGGHVSSQPLSLPERALARELYAISNNTIFINEHSHIFSDFQKKHALIAAIKHYPSSLKLLSEYHFDRNGLFSDCLFALEFEQAGNVPLWAKRFKKESYPDTGASQIMNTIALMKPDDPAHRIDFNLGRLIGEGCNGAVFIDADDTTYIIKKIIPDGFSSSATIAEGARREAAMFELYYGEHSAVHLIDENQNSYIRMYKIPGITLDGLPVGSLPDNADEKYVDMIERLNSVGIIHDDLHSENILWDDDSQTFFPIDIINAKEKYFNANSKDKTGMNVYGERNWASILKEIAKKKRAPVSLNKTE